MNNFSMIIIFVVSLFVLTVSAYTGREKDRFLGQMTEIADAVEVEFDNGRAAYCQAYGSQFAKNFTAWRAVQTQCFENMLLELEDYQDDDEDYEFLYGDRSQNAENQMLFNMYRKCAKLAPTRAINPCNDRDWRDVKKCVRELFITVPAFQANTAQIPILSEDVLQGMNVEHVLSERMMLAGFVAQAAAEISKCTSKTLMGAHVSKNSEL